MFKNGFFRRDDLGNGEEMEDGEHISALLATDSFGSNALDRNFITKAGSDRVGTHAHMADAPSHFSFGRSCRTIKKVKP